MSQASSLHSTRVTLANYPLAGTVFFDVAGLRRRPRAAPPPCPIPPGRLARREKRWPSSGL